MLTMAGLFKPHQQSHPWHHHSFSLHKTYQLSNLGQTSLPLKIPCRNHTTTHIPNPFLLQPPACATNEHNQAKITNNKCPVRLVMPSPFPRCQYDNQIQLIFLVPQIFPVVLEVQYFGDQENMCCILHPKS